MREQAAPRSTRKNGSRVVLARLVFKLLCSPRHDHEDSHHVYNCTKCPGFCCSYPVIAITKRDVERLARYHELSFDTARKRFTKSAHGHKYLMRRKADPHFGKICRFFDTEARRCTIYHARPSTCRAYPGPGRCGYYDFLSFERRIQEDPDRVAITDHSEN